MRIRYTTITVIAAFAIGGFAAQKHAKHAMAPKIEHLSKLPASVELGVSDTDHKFDGTHTFTYEVAWRKWNDSYPIFSTLKSIVAQLRTPILNVEPNPITSIGSAKTLLPDITAGKYDATIRNLAQTVQSVGSPVVIRFAPEMECVAVRPWSMQAPADYIAAFRHFALIFKKIAPTSKMLWSPIGEGQLSLSLLVTDVAASSTQGFSHSCVEYYPGDDVVDFVGCSIYEFPAMSVKWVGHPQSFEDWLTKRYALLAQFNKPIFVAELGIYGSLGEQKTWLDDAFLKVGRYPLVKALVYYSGRDANSWNTPNGYVYPDWSTSPSIFAN